MPKNLTQKNKSLLWNQTNKLKKLAKIGSSRGFAVHLTWLKELEIGDDSIFTSLSRYDQWPNNNQKGGSQRL